MPVFHRPPTGWVGDVIPHTDGDEFVLFYLHDHRSPGTGTPWDVVRTSDFLQYDDHGTAIASGGCDAADFNAYTGSVVEHDGLHHLFYTGHNPDRRDDVTGAALQVVMHAVSDDGMKSWTKVPEHTFGAPEGYERSDWRDPFVFRPDPDGPWRMLLAARHAQGPARRRGVIAQCVSDDLATWRPAEPFWDPGLYVTHECPDVFRMGEWWYLIYSEFSEQFTTRYRMSRNPLGPWQVPDLDSVDGRAFYASKTAGDDTRRMAVGWIATKEGSRDDGAWEWAGAMAAHEVRQNADGTLAFDLPASIAAAFTEAQDVELQPVQGDWLVADGGASVSVPDGFASATGPELPATCLVSATIRIEGSPTAVGLLLRASDDADEGYAVRLEPRRQRMTFDRWPRRRIGPMQWQISGDVPHELELERPAQLAPGTHRLIVLLDDDACVAYLDGQVAMSARTYDRRTGRLGVFVQEGAAVIEDLRVTTRP